jgi:hypothetical protein
VQQAPELLPGRQDSLRLFVYLPRHGRSFQVQIAPEDLKRDL